MGIEEEEDKELEDLELEENETEDLRGGRGRMGELDAGPGFSKS